MDGELEAPKVLIICDDTETGRIWAYGLRQRQYRVVHSSKGDKAVSLWAREIPDLVVLDLNTPRLGGVTVCARLRMETVTPILLLLSSQSEADLITGYQAGADECVSKPLSPALFLAKVNALLQRAWTVPAEALDDVQVGEMRLDPIRRQLIAGAGRNIRLTNLEFRLLHLLMSHPGRVFEAETIVQRVWGILGLENRHLLKNVVYRLRRKIEPNPSKPRYVLSEPGGGYTFQLD